MLDVYERPFERRGIMETKEIQEERVRQLNEKEIVEGDYVLYWMQEAQRSRERTSWDRASSLYSGSRTAIRRQT
jgi:hypothetical protein